MMEDASNISSQKVDASKGTDDLTEASNDDDTPQKVSASVPIKRRKRKVYNGMIECNVEPIRSLITCSLCDGLYREPVTTLKCFHTFCKSCLVTAIKSSYNTAQYNCCPTCGVYFGRDDILANVALPDRILETLIDKVIFPDIAYQDYVKECEFYAKLGIERKDPATEELNPSSSSPAPWAPTIPAAKSDSKGLPQNKKVPAVVAADPDSPAIRLHDPKDTISFWLVPKKGSEPSSPTLPPLPQFSTSVQLRVEHIQKLLALKLFKPVEETGMPEIASDAFVVYCNGCQLEEELSLRFISYAIWRDPKSTLTLEYECHR